jgi:hypothetical protein
MDICTPTVATAALFVSLLLLDLLRREYRLITGHTLFGIVSVLLMQTLCSSGAEFAAWGLFILPFVFVILGLMIMQLRGSRYGPLGPGGTPPIIPGVPTPGCGSPASATERWIY